LSFLDGSGRRRPVSLCLCRM